MTVENAIEVIGTGEIVVTGTRTVRGTGEIEAIVATVKETGTENAENVLTEATGSEVTEAIETREVQTRRRTSRKWILIQTPISENWTIIWICCTKCPGNPRKNAKKD
jgi:hypothetical protein